jgi:hypothetical protein
VKKQKSSVRERRVAEVAARLFLFGVGVLWVLLFLAAAVVGFDQVFDPMVKSYFIGSDEVFSSAENLAVGALEGWYIITIIIVGIFFAFRTFKVIGKWEPKDRRNRGATDDDAKS